MIPFLKTLLSIRLKQTWRAGKSIGWLLILALPFGVIFLLGIWQKIGNFHPWVVGLIGLAMVGSIHWQREDLDFLRKSEVPLFLILLVEYQLLLLLLFTLPVGLIGGHWLGVSMAHGLTIGVPFLPLPQKQQRMAFLSLSWVPLFLFEWRSGLRKNWLLVLPVYLSGILFSQFTLLPLLSMLLTMIVATGFYNELEHRMLLEKAVQEPRFLFRKWSHQGIFFSLVFLPQMILFFVFHLSLWYLMVALLLICQLLLACAIFYKYSAYLPNRQSVNNQTPMALLFIAVIIPFWRRLFWRP